MTRYPHRIRLRGPWECEPLERRPPGEPPPPPRRMMLPRRWADGGLTDFSGRVRFRRRFGYPGQIDSYERVWLTLAGVSDSAEVRLNDASLGRVCGPGPFEFEITRLLRARNELVMDLDGTERGGAWGEVALEVRCQAYLADLRLWASFDAETADLHAAGRVVGEADRPLDLYVVLAHSTAAYTPVTAASEGTPFHIIAEKLPAARWRLPEAPLVRVDLVNGAVVWYTAEGEFEFRPGRPPAGG